MYIPNILGINNNTYKKLDLNKGEFFCYNLLMWDKNGNTKPIPKLKPITFILDKNVPRGTSNNHVPKNSLIKQLNLNTDKLLITHQDRLVYFEEQYNNQTNITIIHYDKIGLPTKLITNPFIYTYTYDSNYTTVTITTTNRKSKNITTNTANLQSFLQNLVEFIKVSKNKIPRSK